MNPIVPAQPGAAITVVASGSVGAGRANASLDLEAGQTMRATVLDLPVRGQALLALSGNSNNRLLVETDLPLRPGQPLSLRLVASEPRMMFSLTDKGTSAPPPTNITVVAQESAILGRPGAPIADKAATTPPPGTITIIASESGALGRASSPAIRGAPTLVPASETVTVGRTGPANGTPLNLEVGQILRATVLDSPVRGQALLALGANGDSRLLVETKLPLQPGQTLALRLVDNEPRMLFTIADNAATVPQLLGRTVAVADKAIAVTTLFTLLQQANPPLLPQLSPGSQQTILNYLQWQQTQLNGQDGGQALKKLIEHLGLNLERNLAAGKPETAKTTLKAALAEIVDQSTQGEEAKGAAQAKTQARAMLSAIETFQLAQTQLGAGKELLYPLPLPFLETGYLLVEDSGGHEPSGEGGKMAAKFSLFLSLTELGFLRIDFVRNPEGVALRFRADSQEKADFAAEFADDLRQVINNVSDLPVISLSFAADAQDPVNELLRKMLPDNSGLVSTTA